MQGPAYGSGGHGLWQANCPQGTVLTGVTVGSDGRLQGFYGVRCKALRDIDTAGRSLPITPTGQNMTVGTSQLSYDCPSGYAINGIMPMIGDWVDGIQFSCGRMIDGGAAVNSPVLGQNNGGPKWTAPQNSYVTGLQGASGSRINSIQPNYADFTAAIAANYTDSGIANGCMGVGDPSTWKYQPGSGDCDSFMVTKFCQQNPTDPRCSCVMSEMTCPNKFDQNCIKNNGYRTADMTKVTCPNVMNCVQYNNLSPGAKALAVNYDQSCSSKSTTQTSGGGSSDAGTINNTASGGSAWYQSVWLWVGVMIVLVILAAIVGYFAMSDGSKRGAHDELEVGSVVPVADPNRIETLA